VGPHILRVLHLSPFFGRDPTTTLADPTALRRLLGLTVEEVKLDWDNVEAVPNFYHFAWFEKELKTATADGALEACPVLGFSADWAGPHAQEAIAAGEYSRYSGNFLQVPVRLTDWAHYVRACAREFRGRFRKWVFWENPDLGGPQGIPPESYPEMLAVTARWIRLHDPEARIVAGGFNFDRALGYLEAMGQPAELACDEIAVQVNLGELSPEGADIEAFLDDLQEVLGGENNRRRIQLTELDWPLGEFVTPRQHAAYHARSLLILDSRQVPAHRLPLVNGGRVFEGYGLFYSRTYGNTENVQTFRPIYVAKPAALAMLHLMPFLREWHFEQAVLPPDRDLRANRAYIYRNDAGDLAVALWRTDGTDRAYAVPPAWQGAAAADVFGVTVPLERHLALTGMPVLLRLPAGYAFDQLVHDLRLLEAADGRDAVFMDLHVSEAGSARRADYAATGQTSPLRLRGAIPGGRKITETGLAGITAEQFEFATPDGGNVLLRRRWFRENNGPVLSVRLNDGEPIEWDLSGGEGESPPGPRESTLVLRNAAAGRNRVRIEYAAPGNIAGYRVEPLADDGVALVRWGVLTALQSKGELQSFRSVSGTPLTIGKTTYDQGFGTHAVSLLEFPLDRQFRAFEVTVGVDAVTDGRGSVVFEVLVDGKSEARSSLLNGFSKPETLRVDGLADARRLVLLVRDGGDRNEHDFANWVDGRLYLRP
jgi:hypothetical protein